MTCNHDLMAGVLLAELRGHLGAARLPHAVRIRRELLHPAQIVSEFTQQINAFHAIDPSLRERLLPQHHPEDVPRDRPVESRSPDRFTALRRRNRLRATSGAQRGAQAKTDRNGVIVRGGRDASLGNRRRGRNVRRATTTARCIRQDQAAPSRRAHAERIAVFLDLENLASTDAGEDPGLGARRARLILGDARARGTVVMAVAYCNRRLAPRVAWLLGPMGVRVFVHGGGPDAADLELIERIATDVPPTVDRVVIASGDHIFADPARALRERGVQVEVHAAYGALSAERATKTPQRNAGPLAWRRSTASRPGRVLETASVDA